MTKVAITSQKIAHDTGVNTTDGYTDDGGVTLTGVVVGAAGTTVAIYDNGSNIGTASIKVDGTWSFSDTLQEGYHTLYAVATDPAGKSAYSNVGQSIVVEALKPEIAITSEQLNKDTGANAHDNISSNGFVTVSGSVSEFYAGPQGTPGTAVVLYDGSTKLGSATVYTDNTWFFAGTLKEGSHNLQAVATDTAGNTTESAAAATIIIDSTAPSIAIMSQTLAHDTGTSATDNVTSNGAVTLKGTVSEPNASSVVIYDNTAKLGTATVAADGSWSFATTLKTGAHALHAVATDLAGNTATSVAEPAITVKADTVVTPPVVAPVASTTESLTISVDNPLAKAAQHEAVAPGTFAMGVNLSGMEYGGAATAKPYWNYTIPTQAELAYYHSQGQDLIRLPINWNHLQPTLGGDLSSVFVSEMQTVLTNAAALGMKVIIDLHNFGGYGGVGQIGAGVTDAQFADVWSKLATTFAGNSALAGYDLMNEPHGMVSAQTWPEAAQAAINAIRAVDMATPIYVEGNNYSSAYAWSTLNPGLQNLADPAHNLIFSAHLYLDKDDSGTHADWQAGTSTDVGVQRLTNFVTWLNEYGLKGDIGELGVGRDNTDWLTALDKTLAYAQANNLQVTYWAGGAWWGDYAYTAEPTSDGTSRPQMAILDKYSGMIDTVSVATVSGTALAHEKIYLSENSVLLATVTADASGSWSYAFAGLPDGVHTIVASNVDVSETGTLAAVSFDLETIHRDSIAIAIPVAADTHHLQSSSDGSLTLTAADFGAAGTTQWVELDRSGNSLDVDYLYAKATHALTITGGDNGDTITVGGVASAGVSLTVNGGKGDDTVTLHFAMTATVNGGKGDDTIHAVGGNITVIEGSGTDHVTTGAGNDRITVGNGSDVIDAGDGRNTVLAGDGDSAITSGSGNDVIRVGAGNNTIQAGDGNNIVITGKGDDTITTGSGDDRIYLGAGNHTVHAGDGNDLIVGSMGKSALYGEAGDDVLISRGADALYGGAGADTFRFLSVTAAGSQIRDFSASDGDKIDLSALLHQYDPTTKAIGDFVQLTSSGSDTVIAIDTHGKDHFTALTTIDGVHVDLQAMIAQGHVVV